MKKTKVLLTKYLCLVLTISLLLLPVLAYAGVNGSWWWRTLRTITTSSTTETPVFTGVASNTNGSVLVAVSSANGGGSGSTVHYSTDGGLNWSAAAGGGAPGTCTASTPGGCTTITAALVAVIWDPNLNTGYDTFLAITSDGITYSSTDGTHWNDFNGNGNAFNQVGSSGPFSGGTETPAITGLLSNGKTTPTLVAVSNMSSNTTTIYYSVKGDGDGVYWNPANPSGSPITGAIQRVMYASSYNGGTFYALTSDGATMYKSTDGQTWTSSSPSWSTPPVITGIATNPAGTIMVAVATDIGNPSTIYVSTDHGVNWADATNGGGTKITDDFVSIIFAPGVNMFFAGTSVGNIYNSTDGDYWVTVSMGTGASDDNFAAMASNSTGRVIVAVDNQNKTVHTIDQYYSATGSESPGASGGNDGPKFVKYNSTGTLNFTTNANYHIVSSDGGCGGTVLTTGTNAGGAAYTTGAITADCTETATFLNTWNVTRVKAAGSGTFAAGAVAVAVATSSGTQYTATPTSGYYIVSITGTAGCAGTNVGQKALNTAAAYTLGTLTADCTLTATFASTTSTTTSTTTTTASTTTTTASTTTTEDTTTSTTASTTTTTAATTTTTAPTTTTTTATTTTTTVMPTTTTTTKDIPVTTTTVMPTTTTTTKDIPPATTTTAMPTTTTTAREAETETTTTTTKMPSTTTTARAVMRPATTTTKMPSTTTTARCGSGGC
ncbi:MAG: hypothetical protein HQK88_13035 [Nitrospirae bacterium]|nr:hypothetical protein [Nitrospirota bacterium]